MMRLFLAVWCHWSADLTGISVHIIPLPSLLKIPRIGCLFFKKWRKPSKWSSAGFFLWGPCLFKWNFAERKAFSRINSAIRSLDGHKVKQTNKQQYCTFPPEDGKKAWKPAGTGLSLASPRWWENAWGRRGTYSATDALSGWALDLQSLRTGFQKVWMFLTH